MKIIKDIEILKVGERNCIGQFFDLQAAKNVVKLLKKKIRDKGAVLGTVIGTGYLVTHAIQKDPILNNGVVTVELGIIEQYEDDVVGALKDGNVIPRGIGAEMEKMEDGFMISKFIPLSIDIVVKNGD